MRREGREKKMNEAVPNQSHWRFSNQANKTRCAFDLISPSFNASTYYNG